jgi:hypothetical protein
VKSILGKYSNFVGFPIQLNGERVNTVEAIWLKSKDEVSEEQYEEFYKFTAHAFDKPSYRLHFQADAPLVINALLRWGSDEQKAHWLPRMATSTVGAYALSEAGSGSDAFALSCRAERDGDGWVLNGQKLWITNGNEADLFIVFAQVDPALGYKGITAFLVERGTPGFSVGKKEDKLGIRASSTTELIFDGCRVSEGAVLGEIGKGYKVAIETLNEGRIGIGAQMVGLAQGAALLPGLSRSGTTIAIGLFTGLRRRWAAEFSFFIAFPTILGGSLLMGLEVSRAGGAGDVGLTAYLTGFVTAAVVGVGALRLVLKLLYRSRFRYFAWYVWLLALVVAVTSWTGRWELLGHG